MTNNNTQIIAQLCAPFPPECITTKTISGRTESWVEQHHLMERLNEVLGMNWSWTIVSIATEPCFVGKKDGQRASCHGRLTMWIDDKPITREGVGDKEMYGVEDARKASCSVAFRHACKFFTTFLWKGEAPVSAPTRTVQAVAPAPSHPTDIPSAQAVPSHPARPQPQQQEEWMERVGEDWNNVLGGICELTHMARGDFEHALWFHGCKFKKDDGNWQLPNTKFTPTFQEFAKARAKWALSAVKEAQMCMSSLQGGKTFELEYPEWNGHGHDLKKLLIQPREAQPHREAPSFPDEVPF